MKNVIIIKFFKCDFMHVGIECRAFRYFCMIN